MKEQKIDMFMQLRKLDKPALLIVPSEKEAHSLITKIEALFYPTHDVLPFEEIPVSFKVRKQRIETLWKLLNRERIRVVTTIHAITRKTLSPQKFKESALTLRKGSLLTNAAETLWNLGYERSFLVRSGGEFSVRGDIVDFFGPMINVPVRLELFGNRVESIRTFDPISQRSSGYLNQITVLPAREYIREEHRFDTLPGKAGSNSTILDYACFDVFVWNLEECQNVYYRREQENREFLNHDQKKEYILFSGISYAEMLKKIGSIKEIDLPRSIEEASAKPRTMYQAPVIEQEEIEPGDYVVHKDYGIGLFTGIKKMTTFMSTKEYLVIKYEDSTIYVPVERLDRVQRYVGDLNVVKIDKVGRRSWRNRVERVRRDIRSKIENLVRIHLLRQGIKGQCLSGDAELERQFSTTFPYVATEDQMSAIEEVLSDLADEKPMDRLLCGDAGYGKTEVALRAIFRCVVSGKQAAVLVPTTVLSRQHYRTFKERLEPYGINVVLLDRNVGEAAKRRILADLKNGAADVVIGTHALLSDSVNFSDLGLLVIDEEQNFGVEQKEKLKMLRADINVLSMSATPIPRSLHMALTGLRDMSVINTPPFGRVPILTYVAKYDQRIVKSAILRELNRGGQVIYVHNRIQDLQNVRDELRRMLPDVVMRMAHGRMANRKLTEALTDFYSGKADLLVCTAIIENGVDIPNANTIIVDDSHRYGLAQLYQLRGRVGRSNNRAFAYFLYKETPKNGAIKRLQALKEFSGSGSGLKLALRDMEIRGIGSVFGLEQHGSINSVGLLLYKELITEELSKIHGEVKTTSQKAVIDTEIEGIPGEMVIPSEYISNSMERMRIYRKLATASTVEAIEDIRKELEDRFGKAPEQVVRLINLFKIRASAFARNVKKISYKDGVLKILCSKGVRIGLKRKHVFNERHSVYVIYDVHDEEVYRALADIFL